MSRKKALVLGSGLLLATSGMAADSPTIENVDLGNSFDHKRTSLEVNNVHINTDIFSPTELNCAYGRGNFQPNYLEMSKREKRKLRRKNQRITRKAKRNK